MSKIKSTITTVSLLLSIGIVGVAHSKSCNKDSLTSSQGCQKWNGNESKCNDKYITMKDGTSYNCKYGQSGGSLCLAYEECTVDDSD